MALQGFAQHISGLRHGPVGGIDQQEDPVDHGQRSLHLATEVCVTRGVDQVDLRVAPLDRGCLGQDGDSTFPFLVGRVHHSLDPFLMGSEHAGRRQHGVDEGRLAVVDVGYERDITDRVGGHGLRWYRHGDDRDRLEQ